MAVRWHLMFPISYRDLALMLLDRGVSVVHTTIFRWIQAYARELEKRVRPHLRTSIGSWRVDETYVKVEGRWTYLHRAVDSRGQTIDFLLSVKRDAEAAKRGVVQISGLLGCRVARKPPVRGLDSVRKGVHCGRRPTLPRSVLSQACRG